jgi:hypothetical protein
MYSHVLSDRVGEQSLVFQCNLLASSVVTSIHTSISHPNIYPHHGRVRIQAIVELI